MTRIILAIVMVVGVAGSGWATTYYIDGTAGACAGNYSIANRNCSGSDGNSYATLAAAVAAASANDTLRWRAGTETLASSVTVNKLLTITNYGYTGPGTGETVTVTPPANHGIIIEGGDGTTISGIAISGGGATAKEAFRIRSANTTLNDVSCTSLTGRCIGFSLSKTGNVVNRPKGVAVTEEFLYMLTGTAIVNYPLCFDCGAGGYNTIISASSGTITVNNPDLIGTTSSTYAPVLNASGATLNLNNAYIENATAAENNTVTNSGTMSISNTVLNGSPTNPWKIETGTITESNILYNRFPYFVNVGKGEGIATFYAVDSSHLTSSLANWQAGADLAGVHISYFPDDQHEWTAGNITTMQTFVAAGHDLGCEGQSSSRLDQAGPFLVNYVGAGANPRVVVTYTSDTNATLALVTDSGTDMTLNIGQGQTNQNLGSTGLEANSVARVINDHADWVVTFNDDTVSYDDTYAFTLNAATTPIAGATLIPFNKARLYRSEINDTKSLTESQVGNTVVSYMYARYKADAGARAVIKAAGLTSALSTNGTDWVDLGSISDIWSLSDIGTITTWTKIKGTGYDALDAAGKETRIRGSARVIATHLLRYGKWMPFLLTENGTTADGTMLYQFADELKKCGVKVYSFAEAADYINANWACTDGACTRTLAQTYKATVRPNSPFRGAGACPATGTYTDYDGHSTCTDGNYVGKDALGLSAGAYDFFFGSPSLGGWPVGGGMMLRGVGR